MQASSENTKPYKLLVIGGSSGIGKATVTQALKLGWSVASTYCSTKPEVTAEEQISSAKHYYLDLTQTKSIEPTLEEIIDDYGDFDALVYASAIDIPGNSAFLELSDWQKVLDVNLTGAFISAQTMLPQFIANKFGRIVFISSLAKNGSSGQIAYSSSKAALCGLSGSLAKEFGSLGINSNIVIPGLIDTPMVENENKGLHEFFVKYGPKKRLGDADEVAKLILFLSSEESSYVNGSEFSATGGANWVY